ncbi:hypothetical protein MRB53_015740 [Persea americana]|uniref:Uncharacterized protein n=1 Tax=Persea americana TaxID=3435 RepID=A0ACC2M0C8_PERAE|nr:hypothetical protein MRB53_015740 [Persea americana]
MHSPVPTWAWRHLLLPTPRIDWKETPEAHVFKADLPGLKKEEVKVEMEEGRVLQISGEKSREKEEKNDKWHRIERSSGKFQRRFRLPENAIVDEVKASMENGVLTITVPKEQVKQLDVKAIDISVREEDGVGEGGVRRETGALEHLTVENELEHVGMGPVPAVGLIEGPGSQAVVCDVRAEIAVDG